MRIRLLLCAAALAALTAPFGADAKSRDRVGAAEGNPFSFWQSVLTPSQSATRTRADRTNKESRLAVETANAVETQQVPAPARALPQARVVTRVAPGPVESTTSVAPFLPFAPLAQAARPAPRSAAGWDPALEASIARHAAANGVPLELARRVVRRESNGNPRAVSKGNYGLMQIRLGTARAMGYQGDARGLLDADTNMTYAMRYLAGAHRAAGGSHDRAVAYYARGYYYEAKAQGFSPYAPPRTATVARPAPRPAGPFALVGGAQN